MNKLELTLTWDLFYTKRDEESKQKLVEYYFPYVKNIAKKLAHKLNYRVSPDELASSGVDGLYKALEALTPHTVEAEETAKLVSWPVTPTHPEPKL